MIYYCLYFILENTFWGFRVLHNGIRAWLVQSGQNFFFIPSYVTSM